MTLMVHVTKVTVIVVIDYRLVIFTHICELQLSFNKLSLLPGELGSFIHLTVLDLRYKAIAVVLNA